MLSSKANKVLIAMRALSDKMRRYGSGSAPLLDMTGLGERSVMRATKELREEGMIELIAAKCGRRPAVWRVSPQGDDPISLVLSYEERLGELEQMKEALEDLIEVAPMILQRLDALEEGQQTLIEERLNRIKSSALLRRALGKE